MIMCGFVLFDTQLIIEKAESGDKDYIWWVPGTGGDGGGWGTQARPQAPLSASLPPRRHCVDLFLDFVNIFRELLMILGMTEVGDGPPGARPAGRGGGRDTNLPLSSGGTGATDPAVTGRLSSCRTRRRRRSEAAPGRGGAVPIWSPSPPCPRPFSDSLKGLRLLPMKSSPEAFAPCGFFSRLAFLFD